MALYRSSLVRFLEESNDKAARSRESKANQLIFKQIEMELNSYSISLVFYIDREMMIFQHSFILK